MSDGQNKTDLQDALREPVIARPQMEKIMAQSIVPEVKPVEPRWYVTFLRTTLRSFAMIIGGFALGFFFVVIVHYTGLEACMDPMRNY